MLSTLQQNFELLILLCREGPVNDAKLKAYLEQFGEVIKVRMCVCVCVCVCVLHGNRRPDSTYHVNDVRWT